MEHSFNIELAAKYGIEEAIIIKNIQFWIDKNKANDRHFYDGKFWTYNSVKAFTELFPYMSESKIRRTLENLVSKGVLIKGNFNQSGYDRTLWYAFQNEQMDLSESTNGVVQNDEPIPDSKQDGKQEVSFEEKYKFFLKSFNEITGKHFRGDTKSKKNLKARIKEGYTYENIKKAIKNALLDPYHKENGYLYITPEFITRSDKLEKFMNFNPPTQQNFPLQGTIN